MRRPADSNVSIRARMSFRCTCNQTITSVAWKNITVQKLIIWMEKNVRSNIEYLYNKGKHVYRTRRIRLTRRKTRVADIVWEGRWKGLEPWFDPSHDCSIQWSQGGGSPGSSWEDSRAARSVLDLSQYRVCVRKQGSRRY